MLRLYLRASEDDPNAAQAAAEAKRDAAQQRARAEFTERYRTASTSSSASSPTDYAGTS